MNATLHHITSWHIQFSTDAKVDIEHGFEAKTEVQTEFSIVCLMVHITEDCKLKLHTYTYKPNGTFTYKMIIMNSCSDGHKWRNSALCFMALPRSTLDLVLALKIAGSRWPLTPETEGSSPQTHSSPMRNMEKVVSHVGMWLEVHRRRKMMQESAMHDVVCGNNRCTENLSWTANECDGDAVVVSDYRVLGGGDAGEADV